MQQSSINLELFGTPRIIAGTRRITTTGTDLRSVLQQAVAESPELREHIIDATGTWLNGGYTFVVDGRFTTDPATEVTPESDVLLVSRASGG